MTGLGKKLKPCPFCGSEAMFIDTAPNGPRSHKGYFVQCSNNLCMAHGLPSAIPGNAVRAWNRRAILAGERKVKTRLEYGILIGKRLWDGGTYCHERAFFDTEEEARATIRGFVEEHRKLGLTDKRKFTVVAREVGPWREVKENEGK